MKITTKENKNRVKTKILAVNIKCKKTSKIYLTSQKKLSLHYKMTKSTNNIQKSNSVKIKIKIIILIIIITKITINLLVLMEP